MSEALGWIPFTPLLLRPISAATQRYLGWEEEHYEVIFVCRVSLCSQWSLPVLPAKGHPLAPEAKKTRRPVCLVMGLQEIIHSREDQTSAHVCVLGLLLGQKESIWYPRQHLLLNTIFNDTRTNVLSLQDRQTCPAYCYLNERASHTADSDTETYLFFCLFVSLMSWK